MHSYYVRFGRRYRLPSTIEILDELRSAYLPDYVRKSWAGEGFTRPHARGEDVVAVGGERAAFTGTEINRETRLPDVYPLF
jgi:hypothetical protein